MRYLKLLVILALLAWTKMAFNCELGITSKSHSKIQSEIVQIMNDAIIQAVPNAQEISCDRIWTKEIDANQLEASFDCFFTQPEGQKARLGMSGSAKLSRVPNTETEEWNLDYIDINSEVYT